MTVLVYTGIDRSIVNNIPPRMGAIIPPLQEMNQSDRAMRRTGKRTFGRGLKQYRKRYLALQQFWTSKFQFREHINLPLVPNMSGVQPYKIAHMAFEENELTSEIGKK